MSGRREAVVGRCAIILIRSSGGIVVRFGGGRFVGRGLSVVGFAECGVGGAVDGGVNESVVRGEIVSSATRVDVVESIVCINI